MGVEQVDPAEPGRSWSLAVGRWLLVAGRWSLVAGLWRPRRQHPVGGQCGHPIRGSLRERERDGTGVAADAIVVHVEPPAEAESRIEDECSDECSRAIPGVVKHRRERRRAGRECGRSVVAYPVPWRHETGEDRRVGGQRHRRMRVRVRETHAGCGQPIERRCQAARPGTGVDAEAIRTQRVNRD